MPNWTRTSRARSARLNVTRPKRSSRPGVEKLEDRTVLQNGLTPNQAFVTAAYEALLQRQPEPAALTAWSHALDAGQLTTLQVAEDIVSSQEFRVDAIQKLYQTLLNRAVDNTGLNDGLNFLAGGGTLKQLQAGILGSAEYFQNRGNGSVSGFLQAIYHDIFNRDPDPTGIHDITQALNGGVSRQQIAIVLLSSPEAITDDVTSLYHQVLQRAPDASGLNAFVTALELNDPPGDPSNSSGSASGQRNLTGSASDLRNLQNFEASITLPEGTVITEGVTVPAGAEAISVPDLNLPPGAVAVLLPGETLPTGATVLTDVTVPEGAATLTIPGVTLPTGTVAVPLQGVTLPNGQVIGGSQSNGTGSAGRQTGSHSGQRNMEPIGATVTLPDGTVIADTTVPAGAMAISIPGLVLPTGAVAVLLPGQSLPEGATVLSGVTIPTGALTLTIPGVTLPSGVVAVPIQGVTLPSSNNVNGSASAQRNNTGSASAQRNNNSNTGSASDQRNVETTTTMTTQDIMAQMVGSLEFFQHAQG